MNDSSTKEISFQQYTKKFLQNFPEDFKYQRGFIQLYNLSSLAKHSHAPTPLLKAQFSFFIHITKGNFSQQVGNKIINVSAPAVLLIAHGQPTSLIKHAENIEGFFVIFENNVLNNLLHKKEYLKLFLANPEIKLSANDDIWLCTLHQLLMQEVISSKPDELITMPLFSAALYKILTLSEERKEFSRAYEITSKFKLLAYENFLKERSVSFYAKELHVSENYLNRCVKETAGKTTKQVLLEIAVIQSQFYLHDLTMNVADIAYRLHFEDPSYFGRQFKKIIGFTPSEYRKTVTHDLSA